METSESGKKFRNRLNMPLFWFALSLVIPSTAIFQRFMGLYGVVGYFLLAFPGLWIAHKYAFPAFLSATTKKWIILVSASVFLFLILVFLILYPIANSGIVGRGSDGDEALNIAANELLDGHYPYYPKTYLGNPITPMPGSILLALPFVLLGNCAWQNFFWLGVFFISASFYLEDAGKSLLLLLTILVFSPTVIHTFAIGGDYVSNSLFVLVFSLWLIQSNSGDDSGVWEKVPPCVLLGVAFSSRPNFILILPLIFSALIHRWGREQAITHTGIICAVFGVVTLPFYFYDPQGFSPYHAIRKIDQFQAVVPHSGIWITLANSAVSLGLAFQNNSRPNRFFRNCAIVLAFPVVCGVVLSCMGTGHPEFRFAIFGQFFLFFGALAFWPAVIEK